MAASGTGRVRGRTWARITQARKSRAKALAWGLFLVIGLPLGLMATLNLLGAVGIYVDVLRPFWRPWPSDILKSLIGIAAFAASLAYLAYREGRETGYKSGTVAATATARNVAEGRIPEPAPANSPQVSLQPPYPPPP
ncbi:MAG TPA: hypothetical protein VEL81_00935 [Thermoplasmata archaeon]|nr:hypothetical protein [Thermoplasmata archaeon]